MCNLSAKSDASLLFNKPSYFIMLLAGFVFILSGCEKSSQLDATLDPTAVALECSVSDTGLAARSVDATRDEEWVYFSLEQNAEVFPADPDDSFGWDVAFQRFRMKVNGGVSGVADVEVAVLENPSSELKSFLDFASVIEVPSDGFFADRPLPDLSDEDLVTLGPNPFFDVCEPEFDDCVDEDAETVNRDHLNTDPNVAAFVFLTNGGGVFADDPEDPLLGWYDYYLSEGSILRSAGDVWMIRSALGTVFKFQMLGYNGRNDDRLPGWMAFQWQSMEEGVTVGSCVEQNQLPLIVASATPEEGDRPLTVVFDTTGTTDPDGEIAEFLWDFGDGETSTDANPIHVFTDIGSYLVKLTVTDNGSAENGVPPASVITAFTIKVNNQRPVANAGPDQVFDLAVAGDTVDVVLDASASIDADGSVDSYQWIGVPNPDDIAQPTLVALSAGSYTFTLTVTDNDGDNSVADTVTIVINAPGNMSPSGDADASTQNGVAPLNVQFTGSGSDPDGAIVSYDWDFGNGDISSDQSPAYIYTVPGTYTAVLTVTDDLGGTATDSLVIEAYDTRIYYPIGDKAAYGGPADLQNNTNLGVWSHPSSHDGRAVMKFNNDMLTGLVGENIVSAELRMYAAGKLGGFIGAAPGDPHSDNLICPPKACVKIDIMTQGDPGLLDAVWDEFGIDESDGDTDCENAGFDTDDDGDCGLAWSTIIEVDRNGTILGNNEPGLAWATTIIDQQDDLAVDSNGNSLVYEDGPDKGEYLNLVTGPVEALDLNDDFWYSWDLIDLFKHWVVRGTTGDGIVITQESYDITRADNGAAAVAAFCDRESDADPNPFDSERPRCRSPEVRPYLVIEVRVP